MLNQFTIGFLLSLVILASSACSSSKISRTPIDPAVFELAARNNIPVKLIINSNLPEDIGRQFTLVVLPLGKVSIPDTKSYIYGYLYPQLAMRGLKPLNIESSDRAPILEILIEELRVSAFDFLVTRKVSASISLNARLLDLDGRTLFSDNYLGQASSLRRYGFTPQLKAVLDKALHEAISPLAKNISYFLKSPTNAL